METALERSALAMQKRSLALFVLALADVLGAATVNLLISILETPHAIDVHPSRVAI